MAGKWNSFNAKVAEELRTQNVLKGPIQVFCLKAIRRKNMPCQAIIVLRGDLATKKLQGN